jgi:hypothetical protein
MMVSLRIRSIALIGYVFLITAGTTGCGNITPSIKKLSQAERDKRSADKEIDRKAKDESGKKDAPKAISTTIPVDVVFGLKPSADSKPKEESEKDSPEPKLSVLVFSEKEIKTLVEKGEVVPLVIEETLPETFSVTLHVLLDKEETREEIKSEELDFSFDSLTDKKTTYSLKLSTSKDLKESIRAALLSAEITLEIKE